MKKLIVVVILFAPLATNAQSWISRTFHSIFQKQNNVTVSSPKNQSETNSQTLIKISGHIFCNGVIQKSVIVNLLDNITTEKDKRSTTNLDGIYEFKKINYTWSSNSFHIQIIKNDTMVYDSIVTVDSTGHLDIDFYKKKSPEPNPNDIPIPPCKCDTSSADPVEKLIAYLANADSSQATEYCNNYIKDTPIPNDQLNYCHTILNSKDYIGMCWLENLREQYKELKSYDILSRNKKLIPDSLKKWSKSDWVAKNRVACLGLIIANFEKFDNYKRWNNKNSCEKNIIRKRNGCGIKENCNKFVKSDPEPRPGVDEESIIKSEEQEQVIAKSDSTSDVIERDTIIFSHDGETKFIQLNELNKEKLVELCDKIDSGKVAKIVLEGYASVTNGGDVHNYSLKRCSEIESYLINKCGFQNDIEKRKYGISENPNLRAVVITLHRYH